MPTTVEFVDIAGLVAGASQGEGLGNKFLAHIRETDAIAHVVRCFEDDDIVHVSGRVDPLATSTSSTPSSRSPISRPSRRALAARREGREGRRQGRDRASAICSKRMRAHLDEGKPVRSMALDEARASGCAGAAPAHREAA